MTGGALEKALREEAKELERLLEESREYRRLRIVTQALADLDAIPAPPRQGAVLVVSGARVLKRPRLASSIQQAALFALEDAGSPVSTREMLDAVQRYGKTVRAKNPVWGLSNTLSTDKRFRSVPWNGARGWWFSDKEVPDQEEHDERAGDLLASP